MLEVKIPYPILRRAGAPLLAGLLASGVGAVPVFAAPAQAPRAQNDSQEVANMRETLQVLMVASMKRALQLTGEQEREVVPKVQRVFDERERYARVRRDAMRDLQQKLAEESFPEKAYLDVVSHLDDLEKAHRELELHLRAEIDRSLNARQQAQMRVFVPRFRRQLQLRIEEARRSRPHVAPTPPAVPWVPDDTGDADDEEF